MMSSEDTTWLAEAIDRLLVSDEQTGGRPSFNSHERQRLERAAEHIVAGIDEVRRHALLLMSRTKELRHNHLFDYRRCESVMQRRLSVLTDEELARLVLNPLALGQLHHQIFFQRPEAWRALLVDTPDVDLEPDTESGDLLDHSGHDVAPQAAESFEELVAALQGRDDDTPRWTFEAPVSLVNVLLGQAPPDGTVSVQTAWLDQRQRFIIHAFGVFRVHQGVSLRARLLDGVSGTLRAEAELANFDVPFQLITTDRLPPRPGDRLVIQYHKALSKRPEVTDWEVVFIIGEPDQPPP